MMNEDMKALVESLRYFGKVIVENGGLKDYKLNALPNLGKLLLKAADALSRSLPVADGYARGVEDAAEAARRSCENETGEASPRDREHAQWAVDAILALLPKEPATEDGVITVQRKALAERFKNRPRPVITADDIGAPHLREGDAANTKGRE